MPLWSSFFNFFIMSANELVKLLDNVKLTSVEEEIVEFGDSDGNNSSDKSAPLLIGRWVSRKPLDLKAMSTAFLPAWNIRKGFRLRDLGEGKFVVEFFIKKRERVLVDGPPHFERQLV